MPAAVAGGQRAAPARSWRGAAPAAGAVGCNRGRSVQRRRSLSDREPELPIRNSSCSR